MSSDSVSGAQQNSFWAVFGKVAMVVTALLGMMQIYKIYNPEKERLVAKCSHTYLSDVPVFALFKDKRVYLSSAMRSIVSDEKLSEILKVYGGVKGLGLSSLAMSIMNEGNTVAEDVVVKIHSSILAYSIDDSRMVDDVDGKEVRVGDIRPGDTLKVVVFVSGNYYRSENVVISSKNSSCKVYFSEKAYGVMGGFVDFFDKSGWFAVILVAASLSLVFMLGVGAGSEAEKKKIAIPSPSETPKDQIDEAMK